MRGAAAWGLANIVGALAFISWSASCCWIEPELKDVPGASGGSAFVWFGGPFLLFAAFALANFCWAIGAAMKCAREQRLAYLLVPFLTLVGWGAAFVFDSLHHGS